MVALVKRFKFLPTYVIGAAVSISLAMLVVRAAINAQSGRFTDSEGYAWSFSLLFGLRIRDRLVEQGWAMVSQEDQFGTSRSMYKMFMVEYAAASIMLMLALLPILLFLVEMVCKSRFSVRLGWVATLALLGITICEGLAASWVMFANGSALLVQILTDTKWLVAVTLVVVLIYQAIQSRSHHTQVSSDNLHGGMRVVRAIEYQRFSFYP